MWGNDPEVTISLNNPRPGPETGTRTNPALRETIINASQDLPPMHLGWGFRLNGPVDNPNSSCLSCHSTAQYPSASAIMPFLNDPPVPVPPVDTEAGADWMRWFRNIPWGEAFDGNATAVNMDFSLQLTKSIHNYVDYLNETVRGQYAGEYWSNGYQDPPERGHAVAARRLSGRAGRGRPPTAPRLNRGAVSAAGMPGVACRRRRAGPRKLTRSARTLASRSVEPRIRARRAIVWPGPEQLSSGPCVSGGSMRRSSALLAALVALALTLPAAAGQSVAERIAEAVDIPVEEWAALAAGRTLTYRIDGDFWAMERYEPGSNRVTLQFNDGSCLIGTWDYTEPLYCFHWEGEGTSCFRHARSDGEILIIETRDGIETGALQVMTGVSDIPLACGPMVTS
jgi:hypothetical protein